MPHPRLTRLGVLYQEATKLIQAIPQGEPVKRRSLEELDRLVSAIQHEGCEPLITNALQVLRDRLRQGTWLGMKG